MKAERVSLKNFFRRASGIVLFALLVSPVLFIAFYRYFETKRDLTHLTFERHETLAVLASKTLQERLDRLSDLAASLATRPRVIELIEKGEWKQAAQTLIEIPVNFPYVDRMLLVNPEGTLMADVPETHEVSGKNFSFRDWYRGVTALQKPYLSEVYQRTAPPQPYVTALALPIKGNPDRLLGILVLQTKMETLLNWIHELKKNRSELVHFIDQKGHLASHSTLKGLVDFSSHPAAQKILRGEKGSGFFLDPILKKEEMVGAYIPLPRYGWGVLIQQPVSEAFGMRNAQLKKVLLFYGAISLISAGLAAALIQTLSAHKKTQEAFQKQKNLLQSILNSVGEGVVVADETGKFILFNPSAEKILGLGSTDASFEEWPQIYGVFYPDRTTPFPFQEQPLIKAIHGESVDEMELYIRNPKAPQGVDISVTARPLKDEHGSAKGGVAVFRDITERKRTEEMIRNILESAPDSMVITNEQGRIVLVNSQTERLFGYTRTEMLGQSVEFLMPKQFRQAHVQHRHDFFKKPQLRRMGGGLELYAQHKNGLDIPVEISLSPIHAHQGVLIIAAIRDVSERRLTDNQIKKLNSDLEQRNLQLESSNKELEAFSYSVSHDLRAPLRAIDGFSRILLEEHSHQLDSEGKRVLGVVTANTKQMGQLIDDLLAFSRLSRKGLDESEIDMTSLAASIVEELSFMKPNPSAEIVFHPLPKIQGDRAMMKQVLVNLISNALKFSKNRPHPEIEVGARLETDETVFYVKDNGVGFEMKYADKLFGVFQRLHSTEEFDGTGVGLAIVQRVIHRHGGRVWAEGDPEHGATFYFSLPRERKFDAA